MHAAIVLDRSQGRESVAVNRCMIFSIGTATCCASQALLPQCPLPIPSSLRGAVSRQHPQPQRSDSRTLLNLTAVQALAMSHSDRVSHPIPMCTQNPSKSPPRQPQVETKAQRERHLSRFRLCMSWPYTQKMSSWSLILGTNLARDG